MNRFWVALSLLFFGSVVYAETASETTLEKRVEAKMVSELALYPEHRAAAFVETLNDSLISAEIAASIDEIPVKVGEAIAKDTLLARLDCSEYELISQRQEAILRSLDEKLDFAGYQLQQAKKLLKQQAISEELHKRRETDFSVLLAEQQVQRVALQQASNDVGNCMVRAPFRAVVLERLGQVGEYTGIGKPLVRIVDTSHLEVSAKLQRHQVDSLKDSAEIAFVYRGESYPLSLRRITPAFDSRERTREARLLFRGEPALPGTAGQLHWRSHQPHLPAGLLVRRHGELGVFVVQGDRAHFYPVASAIEGRPFVSRLPAGELVVTRGQFRLQPGDPVSSD